MSERKYIRSATMEVITNQIKNHLVEKTTELYQQMLNQGMSEKRSIELLAFYLEMYIKDNMQTDDFSDEKWEAFLDEINPIFHVPGEYEFDVQEERSNLRHIQKQYGKLKSDVGALEEELYSLEAHFLAIHTLYKIDSRETKKIIHIVLNRLLDFKNHYTSDYTDYAHEDLLCLADGLEQMCNPFVNPQLYDYLSEFVDLKDESQFDHIFKNVFLCLTRILVSIDTFDKEFGVNGYFRFISQFLDVRACIENGPDFFFNDKTLEK